MENGASGPNSHTALWHVGVVIGPGQGHVPIQALHMVDMHVTVIQSKQPRAGTLPVQVCLEHVGPFIHIYIEINCAWFCAVVWNLISPNCLIFVQRNAIEILIFIEGAVAVMSAILFFVKTHLLI